MGVEQRSTLSQVAMDPNVELVSTPGEIHCFFDVVIGSNLRDKKRMIFKLYQSQVPKTVENFRQLCVGKKGEATSYAGSKFHRKIKGFMIQGGDYTKGDGTGGASIYGSGSFADEDAGLVIPHRKRGLLSMANKGPDTNGSQFFVLFGPAQHLNGKHVVFGELINDEGFTLLDLLENVDVLAGDRPRVEIKIVSCGELVKIKRPYDPKQDHVKDILPMPKKKKVEVVDSESDSETGSDKDKGTDSDSDSDSSSDDKKKKKKSKKAKKKSSKSKKRKRGSSSEEDSSDSSSTDDRKRKKKDTKKKKTKKRDEKKRKKRKK